MTRRESLRLLDRHRLLCAHREGAYGVARWSRQVEDWLREVVDGYAGEGRWYVGRPLLVTSNDYQLRLFNGDTGVVVDVDGAAASAFRRDGAGRPAAGQPAVGRADRARDVGAPSQGSQFDRVTLLLPPADSPLLTRELLYTAVTRAKEHVRIVGTPRRAGRRGASGRSPGPAGCGSAAEAGSAGQPHPAVRQPGLEAALRPVEVVPEPLLEGVDLLAQRQHLVGRATLGVALVRLDEGAVNRDASPAGTA